MASESSEQQSSQFWKGVKVGERKTLERLEEQRKREVEERRRKKWDRIVMFFAIISAFVAAKMLELMLR